MTSEPFWRRKTLAEMTDAEWESLCDGCGRCCLIKLEDIDTGEIAFTDVVCRLFDQDTCRCTDYPNRHTRVPDCVALDPEKISTLKWMPPTCAYRLLSEGEGLAWWHPLVSGTQETVHQAGVSVRGRVISETGVRDHQLEDRVVGWPARRR